MNSLFQALINLPTEQQEKVFSAHMLEGFFFSRYSEHLDPKVIKKYRSKYSAQYLRNETILNLSNNLLDDYPLSFIKGSALLKDIYQDIGERFLSDIDIILAKEHWPKLMSKIKNLDGELLSDSKWWGNAHKQEWQVESDGQEITIEVHSQLFYHRQIPWEKSLNLKLPSLSIEWHFVYLIGHYAFQHNFQKLYWLFDIYFYYLKYQNEFNWKKIKMISNQLELNKVMGMMGHVLTIFFNIEEALEKMSFSPISQSVYDFIDLEFLIEDRQWGWKYWWFKHETKDNWLKAFRYDFQWAWHKGSTLLKQRA
jgi:hypothetical protein